MRCLFVSLLCLFVLAGCQETDAQELAPLSIVSSGGAVHEFKVEMAVTPQQQAQGLMNRTEMPMDQGMLFWFGGAESPRSFWMKNTLISLDMLFIRRDGIIHHIHHSATPEDLTSVPSQGPVAAVLELNGGVSRLLGISKGDKVHHAVFGNALAQ